MKADKVACMVWFVVVVSLAQLSAGRSLGSVQKVHKLQKRFSTTLEETCPPPYEILNKECNDTCTDDDHCPSNKMCCYDGCAHKCMEPLPSVPVVDWVDYEKDFQDNLNGEDKNGDQEEPYPIAEPIIESLDCEHDGKILRDGEGFARGCYNCQCSGGYIMCEVHRCKNIQARHEASGEGSEDSSGDEELGARLESSGQVRQVAGLPKDDSENENIASKYEEGSALNDEGSSPDFLVYRSVKLKRKW